MDLDPTTTKYLIKAEMNANGVVEKPDVIGAIFGQTEGLLGDELDLRDLQKSGRIGRIEVTANSKQGKTSGEITLPSSLDKVETAILAAALESIDRIGPCQASVSVTEIDDVRESKRTKVADRAKELLQRIGDEGKGTSGDIVNEVKEAVRVEELVSYGPERLPAGPNVSSSDSIIVVEGRNDVANLLKNGIKNAIATEGTSIPQTIKDLSKEKVVSAFVDGDRGGELLLKELLQVADVDFVARAPTSREVEEISHKQVMKSLRNKLPAQQYREQAGLSEERAKQSDGGRGRQKPKREQREESKDRDRKPKREQRKDTSKDRDRPKPKREQPKETTDRKEKPKPQRRGGSGRRDRDDNGEGQQQEEREQRGTPSRAASELDAYKSKLDELAGDLEGVLLDDDDAVLKGPFPVRDLADTLNREGGKVHAVVFDGVITQRLLDIAADKKIATIVGMKMGNVTKKPDSVDVYTGDDL